MASSRSRALLCALLLVVCTLVARPFAEMGVNDDFSYIFSARAFAQTGQVHYVGWASAMVGWQLLWGALFAKVFGFSFTAVRASMLVIAAVTTFLLHRTMVRCGLSRGNATLATLTVMLSPLALALSFSFMTDMSGLLCTVLCLYCCVRAIQSERRGTAAGWLAFASVATGIGGTARQTGWLALLMVPCTAWLLRKRRLPLVPLAAVWILSGLFAYASVKWFYRQPYSVQELPVADYIDRDLLLKLAGNVARAVLQCCLLCLPILLVFVPVFPIRNRKAVAGAIAVFACSLALTLYAAHRHQLALWLPPYHEIGNFFSSLGVVDSPTVGLRPAGIPVWAQALLAVLSITGAIALATFLLTRLRGQEPLEKADFRGTISISWKDLLWLTVPFTGVYLALVAHRAAFAFPYDRYFLPLMAIGLLMAVRLYQERVAPEMPRFSYAVLAVSTLVGIGMLHDTFADRRAVVAAGDRLMAAGVPRTAFYGGFEYDAWTQVDRMGWMNVIAMMWPDGFHMEKPIPRHMKVKPCAQLFAPNYPAVAPQYGISFDQKACDGASEFAPEVYRTWLPPFQRELYIRKVTTPTF